MILPYILTIVIRDKFITNEENDAKNLIQGMDECECYQLLITKIVSHAVMQYGQWKSSFNNIVIITMLAQDCLYIEQFFMLEKHLQLWRPETTLSLPQS